MRILYDSEKEQTDVMFSFEDKYHGRLDLMTKVSEACSLIIDEAVKQIGASENETLMQVYDSVLQMILPARAAKELFGYDYILDEDDIEEYMNLCNMYDRFVIENGSHEEHIIAMIRQFTPYPEARLINGKRVFMLCFEDGEPLITIHSVSENVSKWELLYSVKVANFIVDILYRQAFPQVDRMNSYKCFSYNPDWYK